MSLPFSPKQLEFIAKSTKHWNLAHGSVRAGKTICTLFRFMQAASECEDSKIYMIGHTCSTIYRNAICLLFDEPVLSIFRPFCHWSPGNNRLTFRDKEIICLGAKDQGSIGVIQGLTMSLVYCDEITLYPRSVIEMINSRLSKEWSMGFASMNPSHPSHIVKSWIDLAENKDPGFYSLHFTIEDNPYLPASYKEDLKRSSSGLFYKRNYLGLWCLAEGAIFECFDKSMHVRETPPRAAEYWIVGIDVGTTNAFACVVIGVYTGMRDQQGKCLWIEDEYYWDSKKEGRQLTHYEYAREVKEFLEPYALRGIYVDPSAAAFKVELQRQGMMPIDANNDVLDGISYVVSELHKGNLYILSRCKNVIREMESYVWDPKATEKGEDKPLKKNDHSLDAIRYCLLTHKVTTYNPYKDKHSPESYQQSRFQPGKRRFQ